MFVKIVVLIKLVIWSWLCGANIQYEQRHYCMLAPQMPNVTPPQQPECRALCT